MTADPVSELADYIEDSINPAFDLEGIQDAASVAAADAITAVFTHFGLDPNLASHRGFFLAILADIYLNSPVQGRPIGTKGKYKWTNARLCDLAAHLYIVKRTNPRATVKELASGVRELPEYRRENPDTFRKRASQAMHLFGWLKGGAGSGWPRTHDDVRAASRLRDSLSDADVRRVRELSLGK